MPQVAVELRPARAAHVGDVQIAAPAAAQLPYDLAAFGHPVLVAQRPLVDQRDDRDPAARGRPSPVRPGWNGQFDRRAARAPQQRVGPGPPGPPGGRRHG